MLDAKFTTPLYKKPGSALPLTPPSAFLESHKYEEAS